jgi:peptidoglycan hydrolase CwlO-like protein
MKLSRSVLLTSVLALNGVAATQATTVRLEGDPNGSNSTIIKAVSSDLSQQVSQLQNQVMEANEKILTLVSDQQKASRTISALQTGVNTIHQEINGLNNNAVFKLNKLNATYAGIHRTANGRGR